MVGCGKQPKGTVRGQAPKGDVQNVLAVRSGTTKPQVTLSGEMIEKCPTSGCWFRLRDSTGVIKVDTQTAGFVVADLPLQAQVTVSGKIIANGNDVEIEATGIRY